MGDQLKLLVAEGNPSDRIEQMIALGGRPGHACFEALLEILAPGASVHVVRPADPQADLPSGVSLEDFDGVLMTGSGLNIPGGEDDVRVTRQIAFAGEVFGAGVPMYGSCWGLQVAATAAGGKVQASPRGSEMGIGRKVTLTPAGRGHPLYESKAGVFDQPTVHVDEVTHLPTGTVHLASNAHSTVQAAAITFRGGTFWGVQYHPEFDLSDMAVLVRRYAERLIDQGFFADEAAAKAHADRLTTLDTDPSRDDLAWLLGIDADILDKRIRWLEIENWINRLVRPSRQRRRG